MANPRTNFIARLDWLTIIIFLLMVVFGWMNIFSATQNEGAAGSIFDFSQRYSKQFYYILTAFVIAILTLSIDGKVWSFFSFPIYGLTLLILPITILIGKEINGARAWIFIGTFSLQPAEFVKFATALALAKVLSDYNFQIHKPKNLLTVGAIIGLPILLILLQKDTGTALVFLIFVLVLFREGLSWVVLFVAALAIILFVCTMLVPLPVLLPVISAIALMITWLYQRNLKFFGYGSLILGGLFGLAALASHFLGEEWSIDRMFFIASFIAFLIWLVIIIRKKHNPLLLILFTWIGAVFFIFSVDFVFHDILQPHQQSRINTILGLESDPLGVGYNLNQSKIAIGSGGFFGKGFLQGTQTRFNFVPEQSTDFIFCTVGEEWGFLGSLFVLALFAGLILRIIVLAERQRSTFSRVYGYGLASILIFHFAINIGMTIGLVPVIGIPLPFFSYGGSSLWAFTLMLFVFLRFDTDRYQIVS
ncbi:MAG: rod shape-determining protein RodA [Bacteroidales bacterium]|nr:rod shape-determining protein RodA [Bacteroidales bacterium]